MDQKWELLDRDEASGRSIFSASAKTDSSGNYGTYDFNMANDFEVRDANGHVLLRKHGTASGEYWCGAFLFFVKGSNGTQVRLDESDKDEDEIFDVPDVALPPRNPPAR